MNSHLCYESKASLFFWILFYTIIVTARAGIAQLVHWVRYRPHNLGFEFWQRYAIFLISKTSRLWDTPASCSMGMGVKWPGHEVNHSPPSTAVVKNGWSHISTPQYAFMAWTGATAPFFYCGSLKTNALIRINS